MLVPILLLFAFLTLLTLNPHVSPDGPDCMSYCSNTYEAGSEIFSKCAQMCVEKSEIEKFLN
jgi:hypothetical protein